MTQGNQVDILLRQTDACRHISRAPGVRASVPGSLVATDHCRVADQAALRLPLPDDGGGRDGGAGVLLPEPRQLLRAPRRALRSQQKQNLPRQHRRCRLQH